MAIHSIQPTQRATQALATLAADEYRFSTLYKLRDRCEEGTERKGGRAVGSLNLVQCCHHQARELQGRWAEGAGEGKGRKFSAMIIRHESCRAARRREGAEQKLQ